MMRGASIGETAITAVTSRLKKIVGLLATISGHGI
jgi:hypothetical protein